MVVVVVVEMMNISGDAQSIVKELRQALIS